MSMHPHEVVLPSVVLPVVQLVTLYKVALLPAMMTNLQFGLRQLIAEFLKGIASLR